MIPTYSTKHLSSIKEAYDQMFVEDLTHEQTQNIVTALTDFVQAHPEAFEEGGVESAKRIIKIISKTKDDVNAINLISDFSNLIEKSEDYAEELERILDFVS